MRYKAYFFDLFGTLVDIHTDETMPALWKGLAGFYSSGGAEWTWRDFRDRFYRVWDAEAVRMQREEDERHPEEPSVIETDVCRVFEAMFTEKGVKPDHEMIKRAARVFEDGCITHMRLYSGVKDVIKSLQDAGTLVILVSNAQAVFTESELKKLGIWDVFDDIFISSDHGIKKPSPAFFRLPVEKHGLDPTDCLMIGNDMVCDIEGSRAAGIDGYYIHSALSPAGDTKRLANGDCPAVYIQDGMDLKLLKRRLFNMQ